MMNSGVPADIRDIVLDVLDKHDMRTALDRLGIEIAKSPETFTRQGIKFEDPIDDAFKVLDLMPEGEKYTLISAMKQAGMTAFDIGNFLRANKAAIDQSWVLRQQAALAMGDFPSFYKGNIGCWKGTFSQNYAQASWQKITRDARFEMYEKIRQDHGYDPLRVPSWAFTKGMGRTRTAEEYGFQTRESAIQRFTESLLWVKLAERGFVTGTNDMNWDIWNRYYDSMVRVSEKIASGETKLEEGKVFSIEKEMIDCQRYLSLMTQRASLGKAEALAPAASAVFFAPKNKLAKLIAPTTLFSSNPRIRAMAWK